jgi:hypothetical protein
LRKFNNDNGAEECEGEDEQEEVESGRSSTGSDAETEGSDDMDTEQDETGRDSVFEKNFATDTNEHRYSATVSGLTSKTASNPRKSDIDQDIIGESTWPMCMMSYRKKRTVVQHPSAALFLRGLWEEEEHYRRQKQKIPEGVHKPLRSKVLNRKPLPRTAAIAARTPSSNKPQSLNTGSGSPLTSKDNSPSASELPPSSLNKESSSVYAEPLQDEGDSSGKNKGQEGSDTQDSPVSKEGEQEVIIRKKYGPSAALRCKLNAFLSLYPHLSKGARCKKSRR